MSERWQVAGHRWRWELAPAEAGTRVTETFHASRAPGRRSHPRLFGFPTRYGRILEESLRRLAGAITEDRTSA